jgi:microcompartment protein PduM
MAAVKEIVERVITKLKAREGQVYSVNQSQLSAGIEPQIYLRYAVLHLQQPDLGFMTSLSHCNANHPAVATVLEAWSYGVHLHVSLHRHLLQALPIAGLRRLPLTISDHLNLPVTIHGARIMSYADAVAISNGWLVIENKTLVTALAQETLAKRQIGLIRQE